MLITTALVMLSYRKVVDLSYWPYLNILYILLPIIPVSTCLRRIGIFHILGVRAGNIPGEIWLRPFKAVSRLCRIDFPSLS